ncbi:MAG: NlpC/P60 family protein [Ilumatobacteraceae bacterium]
MRSRVHRRAAGVLAVILIGVVAPLTTSVQAGPVEQQEQEVDRIADELDSLENRIGQLEEDYAAALDRIDELNIEIAASQAQVDAQSAVLGTLQQQLTGVALAKFMGGRGAGLTPLFSTAGTFIDELQRDQLSRVALNEGAGTTDELQQVIDDLASATAALDAKKAEQAQLAASLEAQQQQGDALAQQLQAKYAEAKATLGDLVVQEQERRAAAAAARAQAEFDRQANEAAAANRVAAPAPSRGGGAATPATPTAPSTPRPSLPAPDVPAPSSMAGTAISAAQGQLGVPYQFARSEAGVAFDCSGLTKYAWGRAGVSLPHQSRQQYAVTPHVPKDQAQPGDLIFYHSPIGHVAIYLGSGMLIHAPASGDVVKISSVNWSKVVGVSRPG